LNQLGAELDWHVIDVTSGLRPELPHLFPDNDPVHFNAAGHRRVAVYLGTQLRLP
jgi:lysophospholipase L1-like esterase